MSPILVRGTIPFSARSILGQHGTHHDPSVLLSFSINPDVDMTCQTVPKFAAQLAKGSCVHVEILFFFFFFFFCVIFGFFFVVRLVSLTD